MRRKAARTSEERQRRPKAAAREANSSGRQLKAARSGRRQQEGAAGREGYNHDVKEEHEKAKQRTSAKGTKQVYQGVLEPKRKTKAKR